MNKLQIKKVKVLIVIKSKELFNQLQFYRKKFIESFCKKILYLRSRILKPIIFIVFIIILLTFKPFTASAAGKSFFDRLLHDQEFANNVFTSLEKNRKFAKAAIKLNNLLSLELVVRSLGMTPSKQLKTLQRRQLYGITQPLITIARETNSKFPLWFLVLGEAAIEHYPLVVGLLQGDCEVVVAWPFVHLPILFFEKE